MANKKPPSLGTVGTFGRKFAGPSDHAAYLRDGGCAKLVEALAATREPVSS
jgi:hypothetical protein